MLQEVKSEDGETPPPIVSMPLRMSLHEVTRAFQQVPPPPAGITRKASPQSPVVQSTASGSTRHLAFPPHTQPVHSAVGAPTYPPYTSPMLSHSPAPTLMYPHAITPNAMMGGPSAQYPQPMWIPMAAPPSGQTPGGVVRPLPSPYPAHASYMPYPSPGTYGASQPGPPGPPPNGGPNRSRPSAPAGMSPSLSHSRAPAPVAMYHQGSPVLVHPQVMHVQPSYPGAVPTGRGVPMQPSHPTPVSHAGGYTSTTHAPYVRPPW
jgi:serine/arginine repetitive matrix protein 2